MAITVTHLHDPAIPDSGWRESGVGISGETARAPGDTQSGRAKQLTMKHFDIYE
jgi:hypothetical protein